MKSLGTKPRKGKVLKCDFCGADVYKGPCHTYRKTFFCNKSHYELFLKREGIKARSTYKCAVCSKEVEVVASQLKLRKRLTCSRICLSEMRRRWALERRKTYTKHQLDRLERYSPEMNQWRKEVFERDNYTCVWCGARNGNGKNVRLEADHIKPFAYFPDLRYDLSNGRTLCRPCHDTTRLSAKAMREKWGILPQINMNC